MKLAIDQILISDKTRVRVRIDPKTVDEYAEAMKNGAIFPAVTVFAEPNSQRYYLADGETRILAKLKNGDLTVGVDVKEGDRHAAFEYALTANTAHGMRRSSADKHHGVAMALADPHYDDWSLRQLAELCMVSHETVRNIKQESLSPDGEPGGNVRPRKAPPSQDEVDLKELREAMAQIKAFPYSGVGLVKKLGLTPDDYGGVRYCHEWFGEVIKSVPKPKK